MADAQPPTHLAPAKSQTRPRCAAPTKSTKQPPPIPKVAHATPAKHAYTLQELRDLGYGSLPFLYEEMADGNLVATKLGRRTVVLAEHLEAWLASRPLAVSRYRAGRRQASKQGRAKR